MAPDDERLIIQQCYRGRLPLPKKIQDAPEVPLGLELYYEAFHELNTCRTSGFGLQPISWMMIKEYSLAMELDEEQTDSLFYFVRELDRAYLKHFKPKKGKGKSGGIGRS